jgi:drug/metabolite transporter (DMT)-like permease
MYITVIIIWSTTPLAIKLSNDSVSPITAASLRMVLAIACASLIMAVLRRSNFFDRENIKIYFVASLGIFPNLPIVYYSAQFIPSGLIAVIFASSPFMMGLAAYIWLGEKVLTRKKVAALLLATLGLVIIFIDQIATDENAIYGVLLMLLSNVIYSVSSIWVKKLSLKNKVNPLDQTFGALVFSLPGLLLCWYWVDGNMDLTLSQTTIVAVVYLATVGSLIGFVAFFYVLNHLSVSAVSLIPMITPALALWVGAFIGGETISNNILMGTGLIICGLILYEGMLRPKYFRKRT